MNSIFKNRLKQEKLAKGRKDYQNKIINFWELEKIFYKYATESEKERYENAPRFDCEKIVIGISQEQIDAEFESLIKDL